MDMVNFRGIVFIVAALIAVMTSLLMVTRKNPIHSALWMIVTFFAMAVIYLILNAQFIAVAQVMVYAGAIMMLILFVIMLVHMEKGGESDSGKHHRSVKTRIAWVLITVILLAEVLLGALSYQMTGLGGDVSGRDGESCRSCEDRRRSALQPVPFPLRNRLDFAPRRHRGRGRDRQEKVRGRIRMFEENLTSLCYLLSGVLFTIGAVGAILRRNVIVVFMCIELMLNAVNLVFIAAAGALSSMDGSIFVFFIMTVAAVEAAVGLAIFVMVFRLQNTVHADEMNLLKG